MSEATDRIEASRLRLKLAMLPPPRELVARPADQSPSWLDRLMAMPIVGAVMQSVSAWWSTHPVRPMAQLAGEASTAVVRPLAQRNPITLVLVAGAIGAGLAWARPWRFIFRSALLAGLVPQLASRVLSSVPIHSWISMLGGLVSAPAAASRASSPPAAPPA